VAVVAVSAGTEVVVAVLAVADGRIAVGDVDTAAAAAAGEAKRSVSAGELLVL